MSTPTSPPVDPARAKENLTGQILGVTTAFNVLALIVVVLRSYTRTFMSRSFGPSDAFMVLSTLTALLGGTVTLWIQSHYGLGHHSDTIHPTDYIVFAKMSFIQSIVPLIGGIGFLKIAIALELLKLKGSAWAWYAMILWGMIVFVSAYTIFAWLTFFLYCKPIEKNWNYSLDGKCYDIRLFVKFALINTAFNIFTDIAFATLPVPIVWTLKMPLKTRIYLIIVLSLGYMAVAMGVVKGIAQIRLNADSDYTYSYDIQFWGILQLNLGIIAACAPTLKPLVRGVLSLKSLTPPYGYGNSNGYQSNRNRRSHGVYAIGNSAVSNGYARQDSRTGDGEDEDFELRAAFRPAGVPTKAFTRTRVEGTTDGTTSSDRSRSRRGTGTSRDQILYEPSGKNIVRTTEVHISY